MKNYIEVLNYITNYFKKDNNFGEIITHFMNVILYKYYYNQDEKFYYAIKKFSERFYRHNKDNEISKIGIRLNYYSKRKNIDKILRKYEYCNSYKDIDEIIDYILELKRRNYDKQMFVLFFNLYLDEFDIERVSR